MIVICDAEGDGLNPTRIWVVVCRNVATKEVAIFREPDKNPKDFIEFSKRVTKWVGHNFIGWDLPNLTRLIPNLEIAPESIIDTLVVSRLINQARPGGHSLASWGEEFKVAKPEHDDWSSLSEDMVRRCVADTEITLKLYLKLAKYISSARWEQPLRTEHSAALICNELSNNGFTFSLNSSFSLKQEIQEKLEPLLEELKRLFPKRSKRLKEITPRATKHGTISRVGLKLLLRDNSDLSSFAVGAPFSLFEWEEFNPGSPKQRIDRLWEAGWAPETKTKGHKQWDKEKTALLRSGVLSQAEYDAKQAFFRRYGWTTSEENLDTLPETAPPGIKTMVEWLLLSARVRKLEEWHKEARRSLLEARPLPPYRALLENASAGSLGDLRGILPARVRIHGTFTPIGTWTHRMSHSNPNMGNVPKFDAKQPAKTPYSDRMRALWGVDPEVSYLVGVDAESIQLRVLAHYLKDEEFTNALVSGDKAVGTDPHSVNQRALGRPCKSRDDAKTWVYAWLLGCGVQKGASVLKCSIEEYEAAIENLLDKYQNLRYLKSEGIPRDALRGYFEGFDGRYVLCKGADRSSREHYMLGGYLQNGEAVIMKMAMIRWRSQLLRERIPFKIVNFVHDEWQTEVPRDMELARYVASVQAASIKSVGDDLGLACPLAGSIFNGHGALAIGDNWMETH